MLVTETSKIRNLKEFCNEIQENKLFVSWDSTIDRYARTAEKFKTVLTQNEFAQNPQSESFLPRLNTLIERCVNSDLQIAFVGTIKAGKSTLINAILGQNIASTRVTPETAVLTKFRHSNDNYIKVKFYSTEEWNSLWNTISNNADVFKDEYKQLDGEKHKDEWINQPEKTIFVNDELIKPELEKWSSSKHVEHYFVKEIEVGLKSLELPENVVFVDTPGLDDPVKYRSDVTRKYIDRANAVFVCVTAHAMTGEEQKTIYGVFANSSTSEKIYIIGTQVDNFNNPINDWIIQKEEWVKYLSPRNEKNGETCFKSKEEAISQIMPTSAYVENLCREFKKDNSRISEDEKNMLAALAIKYKTIQPLEMTDSEKLNKAIIKLLDYTYVDELMKRIRDILLIKYKQYLFDDIRKNYTELQNDLTVFFAEIRDKNIELLAATKDDYESINERYISAESEVEEVKTAKELLTTLIANAKDDNKKRIEELEKALNNLTA